VLLSPEVRRTLNLTPSALLDGGAHP
jgi:hypothetical protein